LAQTVKSRLFLPLPLVPLQGESLQGEPLSTFVERGIGGEVFQNIDSTNSLKLLSFSKIPATKVVKTLKLRTKNTAKKSDIQNLLG
jgi:hypothetical protein